MAERADDKPTDPVTGGTPGATQSGEGSRATDLPDARLPEAGGKLPGAGAGAGGDPDHPPLRVWMEAARLSNLPTVLSNLLTGMVLGLMAWAMAADQHGLPVVLLPDHWMLWNLFASGGWLVIIAGGCFYAAGMILNDVLDHHHDRHHRPERPIPSGRLSVRPAVIAVVTFNLIGLFIMLRFGLPALLLTLGLLATISAYNVLHRRFIAAVLLMGMVRGLLYLVGAAAMAFIVQTEAVLAGALPPELVATEAFWRAALPPAVILSLYVAIVTWIAQDEADPDARPTIWPGLLLIPLVLAGAVFMMPYDHAMVAVAFAPHTVGHLLLLLGVVLTLLGWFGRSVGLLRRDPPQIKRAVMGWLAGLCLIDAFLLALMGRPAFVVAALVCFITTILWQRRIMAT